MKETMIQQLDRFEISIDTSNAIFDPMRCGSDELTRILRDIAKDLEGCIIAEDKVVKIRESNGNTVGRMRWYKEPQPLFRGKYYTVKNMNKEPGCTDEPLNYPYMVINDEGQEIANFDNPGDAVFCAKAGEHFEYTKTLGHI